MNTRHPSIKAIRWCLENNILCGQNVECFLIKPRGIYSNRWSQWPRDLRRRSAAARLLRSWVRIPPGAWMFVLYECCVLSGRGLCDELMTRPEESYRLWYVIVCDLETSRMRRPWPALGPSATKKKIYIYMYSNQGALEGYRSNYEDSKHRHSWLT